MIFEQAFTSIFLGVPSDAEDVKDIPSLLSWLENDFVPLAAQSGGIWAKLGEMSQFHPIFFLGGSVKLYIYIWGLILYIYIYVYVYVYVCIYIYAHTHIYVYIYIYIITHIDIWWSFYTCRTPPTQYGDVGLWLSWGWLEACETDHWKKSISFDFSLKYC